MLPIAMALAIAISWVWLMLSCHAVIPRSAAAFLAPPTSRTCGGVPGARQMMTSENATPAPNPVPIAFSTASFAASLPDSRSTRPVCHPRRRVLLEQNSVGSADRADPQSSVEPCDFDQINPMSNDVHIRRQSLLGCPQVVASGAMCQKATASCHCPETPDPGGSFL